MIESTCIYLEQKDQVLMLYRNKKKHDVNAGMYIGVGGKKEPGETIEECLIRETKEETGLTLVNYEFCGIILFKAVGFPDEKIWFYRSGSFTGEMQDTREGELVWVNRAEILNLRLWEGDRIFLKRMLKNDIPFFYEFSYDEDGNMTQVLERQGEYE